MSSKNSSAKDFFLYLFATFLVYFLAINLISLLWQYVNYFFPAPYEYGYDGGTSGAMIFAVSSLLVLFPIYAIIMRFLGRDIDRHPEKKDFTPRRWLIYVTLFIAAVTMVVDLVVLVNAFLSGDFAARFIFKALSVLLVSALLFWYYIFNLRREPGKAVRARKTLFAGSLVLLIVLIVGAFFIAGGPQSNRKKNYDRQRVADLSQLQWRIVNYWQDHETLPESLEVFNDPILQSSVPLDPETSQPYVYEKADNLNFRLCANFSTSRSDQDIVRTKNFGGFEDISYWQHSVGEHCFDRKIDPELHKMVEGFGPTRVPIPANF